MKHESKLSSEDGKFYERHIVDSSEIDAIVRRNALIAENTAFAADNQHAGAWHPTHVDIGCQHLQLGGLPKNAEERARLCRWLAERYPYGVISKNNLKAHWKG